jgi:hypothetical protein
MYLAQLKAQQNTDKIYIYKQKKNINNYNNLC